MEKINYNVPPALAPYINCILVEESAEADANYRLPLYADGYPGIMFQQAANDFLLMPRGKVLSDLFLYGQTLDPVALEVQGPFRFVVFQLYPFASRYLLGVDPKVLNDDCFDLLSLRYVNVERYYQQLMASSTLEQQVQVTGELMLELIQTHQVPQDDRIQQGIVLILQASGQLTIRELLDRLHVTERTFERNFSTQVGLTPKQFARIVQFQHSLHTLNEASFSKLTEVGLDSGFADQSHFIRAFKKYTGQTPSYYLRQQTAH